MRDTLIEFMDSLRDYVAESGTNIAHDERDSSEFVDIFLNQGQLLSIDSVSGWRSFDTPPEAEQEILIVWETYPPEKRKLSKEDLKKDWEGMRWLPIPAYR